MQSQDMTAKAKAWWVYSHHFCTRRTIGALRQPAVCKPAPTANSKRPPTLTWYSTEPGHNRAVPVSREWDNLGGGRGYGRPRPVAVGARRRAAREARGGSLLWGRNNPNYTSTLTQATRGEAGGQRQSREAISLELGNCSRNRPPTRVPHTHV